MKKAIIAGLICMGLGGGMFVGGVAASGCDAPSTGSIIKNTYTVTESFSNISVDVMASDVRFATATDGVCKVVCKERENIFHSVEVVNGCLTVELQDERAWYEHIGFYFGEMEVTVYLPQAEYENISLTTQSGDIEMQGNTFANMRLHSTSGEIEVGQVCVETLNAHTTSGDIELNRITAAQDISVESTSGDIELSGVNGAQNVALESTSGKIEFFNATSATLTAKTTSGRVEMTGVVTAGKTEIKTVSGGVTLNSCDGESYLIKTSSGSVRGSFRTAKQFVCGTSSGNIQVPHSTVGGVCEVKTSSGNIRLAIEN